MSSVKTVTNASYLHPSRSSGASKVVPFSIAVSKDSDPGPLAWAGTLDIVVAYTGDDRSMCSGEFTLVVMDGWLRLMH